MKKLSILFAALLVGVMSWGADPQVTLSITQNQSLTSLSYDFTATSDGTNMSTSDGAYIKSGSGSKSVSHITLETEFFNSKLIKSVQVWGTSAANTNVSPKVYIGDTKIGEGEVYTTQNASSGGTKFEATNTDEKTGTLKVEISRATASKNAIYFNKLIVTYTEGDDQEVNSLEITEASISVEEGQNSDKLTVVVDPVGTKVFWGSKDESIATVADGVVTGVSAGTTKVYAKAGGKSDTCEVTVTENASAIMYDLVTPSTELSDGDTIMIGQKGKSVLMGQTIGSTSSSSYFLPITTGLKFNVDYTKCRRTENALFVLEKNGEKWNLKGTAGDAKDKYLSIDADKKLSAVSGTSSNNTKLNIAITSSNAANISRDGLSEYIRYNSQSGSERFTVYSAQNDIAIYYIHDPDAGKIECDSAQVRFPDNALVNKEANGTSVVTFTGTNITDDGFMLDLTGHHAEFSIDKDELAAAGGQVTITYALNNVQIQAADTTLLDTLYVMATAKNGKTLEMELPISVKIMKEYFPVTINSILVDSIAQMGGVHMGNSTNEITGKDLFLLNEVTVVYKGQYESIVKDATGFLCIKSNIGDFAAGDVISGVRGRLYGAKKRYYFKLEGAVIAKTGTAAVAPEVITDLPVIYADLSHWVKYESVTFSTTSGQITFGEEKLYCQNTYGYSAPSDTQAPYTVEGIVSVEGKYIQLLLTAAPVIDPTYERPVSGVTISKSTLTLNVGNSETLTATVKPDDAFNKNVTWSVTEGASIVKVDQDGKVTGLQAGEAVVTVTSQADATKKASCTVTVTDNVTMRYEKVTSIDELEDGTKVLIVAHTQNKAAGAFGTKNFAGVDVTIDANVILSTNAVGATVFTLGKNGDKWTISDNGNLVGREGTELREGSGTTDWIITIGENCDTILCQVESYGDRFFVYNNNNTSLFAAYASYDNNRMHPVKLFREAGKELVDVEPTGIIVNPGTQEVVIGSTLQAEAVILPAVSKYRDVVWESMSPAVATVDDAGLISAVGVGEAKIVAKSARNNDITDTCFLSVRDSVHVESVTIKINNVVKTAYSIRETKTVQLTAVITPENADVQQVEWRSSDETVATVSADGLVSALEAGTAIITADSKDRGVKAELTLTVSGTPRIVVNKTEIAFANVVYKGVKLTHRDSIEVEGKWLTDPINVRITGEGFSANVSELPKEGGKLYIDYSIEKGGDFEGQMILSTEGALAVSISLSLHADEEMTIAKILEREPEKGNKTGQNQYLLNDVVVTYQNGNKLYVRDATGSLLITNATGTFENGTILKGIVGRIDYVKYNPEMVMSVQPTAVAGPSVVADTLTTYPVRKDISNLVILPAVKFNKAVTLNATTKEGSIKFDGGNLTVYNTYEKTFAAVDTRHVYNILGTIMKYGDNYYEVSPIEIAVSTDPYMYAEYTFAYFDDNEIDASGKAIGSEEIALDTLNIKELKIEGTSIFGATYENGKLTVNYVATEAGKYEGTVTVTGIPTKEGASNVVIVIDCDVTIAAYSDPVITVDKDEIVFDSITVKYMEHQTGSAVVTVTTQNVKNLTVSNSNKDVFNAVLNGNKLTISYDVYKGGEYSTIITLKGEAEVAGKKVDNVTIRARISVGQYPDEEGVENVNAEQFNGIRFNILGQRVDENYRGVVIENGQKKLVK